MAFILHLETSSPVCSVALSKGSEMIRCIESNEANVHSSHLSIFIRKILEETGIAVTNLSAVAVSNGPGSYTGLRIGLSTAKGICYGGDLPLITVDSLQVMASWFKKKNSAEIHADTLIVPLIDARRKEVYAGYYDTQIQPVKNSEAVILDELSFEEMMQQQTCLFIGSGAEKTKKILKSHYNSRFFPDFVTSALGMIDIAWNMYQQQQFADLAYSEPFYLKQAYTTSSSKKII